MAFQIVSFLVLAALRLLCFFLLGYFSVSSNGLYALGLMPFLASVSDFGFRQVVTVRPVFPKMEYRGLLYSKLVLSFLSLIGGTCWLYSMNRLSLDAFCALIFGAFVVVADPFIGALRRGKEYQAVSKIISVEIIILVIGLAFCIVGVVEGIILDLSLCLCGLLAISSVIRQIFSIVYSWSWGKGCFYFKELCYLYLKNFVYGVSSIAYSLVQRFLVLISPFFVSSEKTGELVLIFMIVQSVQLVSNPLAQYFLASSRPLVFYVLVAVLFSLVSSGFSVFLGELLIGYSKFGEWDLVLLVFLSALVVSFYDFFRMYLLKIGFKSLYLISVIIAGFVQVVLVFMYGKVGLHSFFEIYILSVLIAMSYLLLACSFYRNKKVISTMY